MVAVTINHVTSNEVHSQIFDDIFGYFKRYANKFTYQVSPKPIAGAMIRHYHRPNLETALINPAVVTVHHDLNEADEWLNFSNYEAQYRQADLIICLNNTQKRILGEHGIRQTTVIPHGYNDMYLRPQQRSFTGERKIVIGLISRRYPRKVKGEAYLQDLLKRLNPDQFSFLFVGQDRSIDARYARELGFEVQCHEQLPYAVLCSVYNKIDILLIASSHEGGPANVPEALATHTPIATTPVGMAIDMVHPGRNGILLTRDPDIDAYQLSRLYENPDMLSMLFQGAVASAAQAVTWGSVVAQHEEVYSRQIAQLLEHSHG